MVFKAVEMDVDMLTCGKFVCRETRLNRRIIGKSAHQNKDQ